MRRRWLLIGLSAPTMLAVVVGWMASAQVAHPPQGGERLPAASLRPHVLLTYRQEGGIAGPGPSLVVSKSRWARVSEGTCAAKFRLKPRAWRRLRAELRRARIGSIAGDYLPQRGADIIIYVIKAHVGTVRVGPGAGPRGEEVLRQLEPLLRVLDTNVSAGERRMEQACGSAVPGPAR